jgi:hypothetical protein
MAWIRPHLQGVSTKANTQQQWAELQGVAHDDSPSQIGIRTTYSWVRKKHIERYLNEFSYRLNRSQSKAIVFNNLIKRMVKADKIYPAQILCP